MLKGTSLGEQLHRRVPPERWTVTKQDLKDLRKRLVRAIQEGMVKPTERDEFDPKDNVAGPNIYTINDQFIKPITKEAGMMSWALMLHPEGLLCDLFVTHAWQEGSFEFIDKVLHSWPRGRQNAYCCMLSNPQNLDIAGLIASPSDSPFAKALMSAGEMLVVPNGKVSIYTRLWCAYEAYLAYENDKVIQIAQVGSPRQPILRACSVVAGAAVCGSILGQARYWAFGSQGSRADFLIYYPALLVTLLGAIFLSSSSMRQACHILGAAAMAYYIAVTPYYTRWMVYDLKIVEEAQSLLLCFHLLAEADRVRGQFARLQADQLLIGFSGSICDASCSCAADADSINGDIAKSVPQVDHAIQTLIKAGAWNPRLRRASDAGVDITQAAHIEFAIPFCVSVRIPVCVHYLICNYWNDSDDWLVTFLLVAIISVQAGWLVHFWHAPLDKKVFGIRSLAKLLPILFAVATIADMVMARLMGIPWDTLLRIGNASELVASLVALVSLVVGVDGVARLPMCGPGLAQFLMARRWCQGIKAACQTLRKLRSESNRTSDLENPPVEKGSPS